MPHNKPLVRDKSNSTAQRRAEEKIRAILQKNLDLVGPLEKRRFEYGRSWMEVDCFAQHGNEVVLAEINAHFGVMKTATRNKVLKDILKLTLLDPICRAELRADRIRKLIVFTNDLAAKFVTGEGWAAEAVARLQVEPMVINLTKTEIKALQRAQYDQDLRN